MERIIMHIDVNNAFLSWTAVEMLKKGSPIDIRTIPSIIGGDERTRSGIVLAKSNLAKEFGIKTAETIYSARIKCPQVRTYLSNPKTYIKYSNLLYNLLCKYSDKVERYSIDECFLDMTQCLMKRNILEIAEEISKKVKDEFGFTVNIGIAESKVLAKMASDFEKPDKIHTLYNDEIETKMWNLPVSELFMLGKKTVPKLKNMQINTIGELAKSNREDIIRVFGKHGNLIWEYSNGIDRSKVGKVEAVNKSISKAETLPEDASNLEELEIEVKRMTEDICFKLRKDGFLTNTVSINLRTSDFIDFSHQEKLEYANSSTKLITKKAVQILNTMFKKSMKIRLVGIKLDDLVTKEEAEEQISLFVNKEKDKQEKLDSVIDNLKSKYGKSKIGWGKG